MTGTILLGLFLITMFIVGMVIYDLTEMED